ncbi:hypothetical protein F4U96_09325 [Sphingobium limneticum]|uniref:Uncharacterized protein n=2 Tax=Sphingobium limneticum TaxID=1007511 RepID=A0ABQ6TFI6_9SPHN|nr:hypothetical protein [Sphingobium limneticum]KAA9018302.1 hypothetical protein F4U96_09325 [Sphingobium limneticum]
MAHMPIPVSQIEAFAAKPVLRLSEREQWAFKHIIRQLDGTFLTIEAERSKASGKGRGRAGK